VVGKSTVARICKDVADRYASWCERDLSIHDLVYLYWDAIYLRSRPRCRGNSGVASAVCE